MGFSGSIWQHFWKNGDFMVYCVFFDPLVSFGPIWCVFHLVGGLFCAIIVHLVVKAIFYHFKLILLFNYSIWPHLRPRGRVRKPKSAVHAQTTLTSSTVHLSPPLKGRVHILTEHTTFWRHLQGGQHTDISVLTGPKFVCSFPKGVGLLFDPKGWANSLTPRGWAHFLTPRGGLTF